jgi:predicted ester cyclase
MTQENKALARRYFEELDRRKGTPLEVCAPNCMWHIAGFPPMNLDASKGFYGAFYTGFPELKHPIDDLVAEGDKVAFRVRFEGTHSGEFMGVPASGRSISAVGIGVLRISGGKVVEFWGSPDRTTIMQQIGALPA